eukprot:8868983-Pyramimonas_sp.AAC.1
MAKMRISNASLVVHSPPRSANPTYGPTHPSVCQAQQGVASPCSSTHIPSPLGIPPCTTAPFWYASAMPASSGRPATSSAAFTPTTMVTRCGLAFRPCADTENSRATRSSLSRLQRVETRR